MSINTLAGRICDTLRTERIEFETHGDTFVLDVDPGGNWHGCLCYALIDDGIKAQLLYLKTPVVMVQCAELNRVYSMVPKS